jgi:hypothetical protein
LRTEIENCDMLWHDVRETLCGVCCKLKSKATVGKSTLWALAFVARKGTSVNSAALNTVINHLWVVCLKAMAIAPITVEP